MSLILRTTKQTFGVAICASNYQKTITFQQHPSNQRLYTTEEMPKNLLESENVARLKIENGRVYDTKPAKMYLDKDKVYKWCACGRSKTQPICNGTHKNIFLWIKQKPITFQVEKSGDYWLCNCKQTKHRPFCDGTHKLPHIQALAKPPE